MEMSHIFSTSNILCVSKVLLISLKYIVVAFYSFIYKNVVQLL